jgi:hypothetical protein
MSRQDDILEGDAAIRSLEQELAEIRAGRIAVGKFRRYASKAQAERSIGKAIEDWRRDIAKWARQLQEAAR